MNVFGKYSDENLSFCKKFHAKIMVSGQRKVENCPIQAFQHFQVTVRVTIPLLVG